MRSPSQRYLWTGFSVLLVLVVLCLGWTWPVSSTEAKKQEDTPPYTLQSSIEYAILRHPSLQSVDAMVSSASDAIDASRARYRPALNFSLQLVDILQRDRNLFINGVFLSQNNSQQFLDKFYTANLVFSVPLFIEGEFVSRTLPSERVSEESYRGRQADYRLEREEVTYNVVRAFLGISQFTQGIQIAEEAVRLSEARYRAIREKFNLNLVSKNDLLLAEVEWASRKEELQAEKNGRVQALRDLTVQMGRDPQQPIEVRQDERYPLLPDLLPIRDMIVYAHRHRAEIAAQEASISVAQANVELARSDRSPKVNFSSSYILLGDTLPIQSKEWQAVLSLGVPLFDSGYRQTLIAQSSSVLRAQEALLDKIKNNVTLEVQQVYLSIQNLANRRMVLDKQIQQLNEAFKLAEERYRQNMIPFSDLLGAQFNLMQARKAVVQSDYDQHLNYAVLRRAVGQAWTD